MISSTASRNLRRHPQPIPKGARAQALALLLVFWWISVRHLAVAPAVYEDEPWIASVGWKLAQTGVFGSDIMAGLHGMDTHYASMPPLHPALLAAAFRLIGLGLWQARWVVVVEALLVAALTYALGRRLFGPAVGVLAVAGLLLVRTAGVTPHALTGTLLLDLARLGRYDVGVALFGLAALHALIAGRRTPTTAQMRWHVAVGALAGLASLSHFYGGIWLPVLALIVLLDSRATGAGSLSRGRRLMGLAIGFAIVCLPYLAYSAGHLSDWRLQLAVFGERIALLDPSWYAWNLLTEFRRYGPGLGPAGWQYLLRPGFWLAVVAAAGGALSLAGRAFRRGDAAARYVAGPLLVFPPAFALFVPLKVANYLIAFWPVIAVVMAWGVWMFWRWADRARRPAWRAAAVLVLAAVGAEGISRIATLEHAAAITTPYANYAGQVRAAVVSAGPAPRVLGLHTYWFGLDDLKFTSWFVPISLAAPDKPHSVAEVLNHIAPDVVLIDAQMRLYLEADPSSEPLPAEVGVWLNARFGLAASVDDATYGTTEVYARRSVP